MYKGQIICIIVIIFIGILHFLSVNKGKKQTKPSVWFSRLLVMSFFQLLFDIWSVYTVNHLDTVSPILNRLVHIGYMSLMQILFYLGYKYLKAVVEEEIGSGSLYSKYEDIPIVLANLGVVFLPLVYIETPKGNYSYGPAAYTLYVGVAIYLGLIIKNLIKYWNDIPAKKRTAMIIVILSELIVAIYQIIIPTALITCLAIALFNLGIYLTTENPDALLVEQLAAETKRADIANQAKTSFLANMSHEIRTPINAVLGMNEVILREAKDPSIREYARDVDGAAKSLLSIINDILDITKIEAGKLTIIPVEYDFASMVHDVTNMISFKAKKKDLAFKVEIDEEIPCRLLGDDIRIRQILINLLNNAVKYTHEGTVTLKVTLLPCEIEGEARLYFSVKDTGIGIKEEDIAKLYVPFERIEEKRNRGIEGTGLGMNITMQLLALLDSRLEIASVYGEGSEFSFVLQQKIMDERAIGKLGEKLETEDVEPNYHMAYQAPEAKILVVDDNAMNRKVFCSLLKDSLMQIEEAADGFEAVEMVKQTAYDIIFLDHMMPEMDGIETLKVMKRLEDYPSKNAPVVMLTANAIVGAREQYMEAGFDDFLSKPIDTKKLEEMILSLLDKNLVTYVERVEDEQEQPVVCDVSELPVIEGLDWVYASAHFKDTESLVNTVQFFASAIEFDAKELEKLFAEIDTEDGRKRYCTKVHGMKSSASVIGIIPLAGMAKVLEDAARKGDVDTIREMTPILLRCWREYKQHLSVFTADTGDKKNAADYEEEIEEILQKIKAAAEEMDIDTMDAMLKNLEEYEFEADKVELIDSIKEAIINLDVDFLQDILN